MQKNFQLKNYKVIPNLIWNLPLKSFMDKQQTTRVEDPGQKPSGMTLWNNGFTLIELLVVVLIIGILAAVALPQYQVAVEKSRTIRMMPLIKAIEVAQEEYRLANGNYTDDFSKLTIEMPAGGTNNPEVTGGVKQEIGYTDFLCLLYGGNTGVSTSAICTTTKGTQIEKYFTTNYYICWGQPATISDKVCKSISGKSTRDFTNGANGYSFK